MASFRFALKDPRSSEKTQIRLQISYGSARFKIYIGESVNPDNWNQKSQKVKGLKTAPEINGRLSNIKIAAENAYRHYLNEHNQAEPPGGLLKQKIERAINRGSALPERFDFFTYYSEFVKGKEVDYCLNKNIKDPSEIKKLTYRDSAIPGYKRSFELLKEFSKSYRVDFETINSTFRTKYIKFLQEKHNFEQNTIARHFTLLRAVLNSATNDGLNNSLTYKGFRIRTRESHFMYLNETELEILTNLELREYQSRIRDLFLVGCWSGLRYSDFNRLSPDMIDYDNERIRIKTLKTGNQVTVPFLPELKAVLIKYKESGLPSYQNQVMNRELKNIGKHLSTKIEELKLSKHIEQKDYSRISTHSARRSFCSNMFLRGIPPADIMPISGHKTEREFLKYIRVSNDDRADRFKQAALQNKPVVNLKIAQ